jgi:RNA polymerase-binding protein DksA
MLAARPRLYDPEYLTLDTEHYRKLLLDLKREVSGRIDTIDRDIRHEGMTADWSEQASERENDEVLESLGNSSEQELAMIKYALLRIEEGSYFQCAECGEDIPLARLDLLPYTAHCVDCAEKIED